MIFVPRLKQGSQAMQLNLTAMLDVVLQLILFFVLVNNLGVQEQPALAAPNLTDPQVQRTGQAPRLFVNLLAGEGEGEVSGEITAIKIGSRTYEPANLGAVTEAVASEVEGNQQLQVLVRADARLRYEAVRPLLEALAAAGVWDVGLVALSREMAEGR